MKIAGLRLQAFVRKFMSCSRGYAVAEFAVTLPAILLTAFFCTWFLSLCVTQIQLETLAGSAAREISRGNLHVKETSVWPVNVHMQITQHADVVTVSIEKLQLFPIKFLRLTTQLHASSTAKIEK